MNMKRIGAILVLCLLGFTLFTVPASVTADQGRRECYPAHVTAKGNMTLTDDLEPFNISIQANFTAMVPTQLTYGDYNASFSGEANVSNETIKFRGTLTVEGYEFHASFTVPNTFSEIPLSEEEEEHEPEEEYNVSGELEITITQISAVPKEKTWVKIRGDVNSYGGQPAFGWLKAHAKFGEWARVNAFFMPGGWTSEDEPDHSFHNANVTVEGNLTLTCASESKNINITASFTARIPEEIESGNYTASYEGSAYVTNDTVRFRGELSVDDKEFPVDFTISNKYPELTTGSCTASGELTVTITRLPATYFEYAFYAARLVNTSIVELNYSGNDFYISGLWDVYNITWAYSDEDNFNMTVKPVVVNGTGEFNVTNSWKDFTLDITGVELVSGKVVFLCYRSFVIPPGDVNDDYVVDIFDLVHIGKRYGTTPGIAEFDFDLDFNDDSEIDVYDLTTIGANLGEEY